MIAELLVFILMLNEVFNLIFLFSFQTSDWISAGQLTKVNTSQVQPQNPRVAPDGRDFEGSYIPNFKGKRSLDEVIS